MKRIYLYLLFLICTVQNIVAQSNVAIHGESVNAAGRKIELLRMSDPISDYEILLDSIRIGENQKFELRCYTNYPMLVTLQIENYSQSFYVEPAREYNILIPQFDWNLDETKNVFLDPEPLPLVFRNIPPNDINYQIDSIDRFMARFINDNYFYFDQKFKPSVHYFDSLASELNKHCPDVDNDFVNRYKEYQLATLKYYLKYDTRKNLVNKYIKNHPILYNDENYMSLFAMIYANSISKGTRDISVHRLAYWVNNLDLDTYIDSIGMDPLLRHEQVRELAALQALKESYYNFRYYDGEMVIKMIEKLAAQSKFPDHKKIAKNLIYSLRHGDEESNQQELTSCKLIDVEKNPVMLDSMKGKWIYVAFVRVSDPNSILEIETMAHFKKQVYEENNDVAFVTIDCDREFQKMFHFLKNSKHGDKYDWTWLYFDGNYDLLRKYQITAFPWFILINPEGTLQYDITPAPSTGFLNNAPWKKQQDFTPERKIFGQ